MEANNILIIGLLLHFVGDYLLQNDWMATNKTKQHFAAAVHSLVYAVPFMLICRDEAGNLSYLWLVIWISHFFIDRYRLATYWIKLVNWNWQSNNFGFDDSKPQFMSIWLLIIIDNTIHILINTLCLI